MTCIRWVTGHASVRSLVREAEHVTGALGRAKPTRMSHGVVEILRSLPRDQPWLGFLVLFLVIAGYGGYAFYSLRARESADERLREQDRAEWDAASTPASDPEHESLEELERSLDDDRG